jgi:glycosyltransferase involved in cell wall biosynthesis
MHVTVCIATRNRGGSIADTLRSLDASRYRDFDIVVVDQSVDDATEQAVRLCADGLSITYVRSASAGLSRARNLCIEHAHGPIVAFTDDDCEVGEDWMNRIVESFRDHPDVAEICGSVLAGPHDPRLGFIPTYPITARRQVNSPWTKWREGGIGANMSFRLDVLRVVGAFDEVLGAGGPLYTCEDGDMTYRVLRAGYRVLELPEAYVIHHGKRDWKEGQVMMYRVGVGVGAAYMKHLRLLDLAAVPLLLIEWARCISWKRLLLLQPHVGLRRFLGYARGLGISYRYDIDSQSRTYRLPQDRDTVRSRRAIRLAER